jgi:ketosteroid isomerase-like protein
MQQSEGVKEAMLRFYDRFTANDAGSFDRLVSQEQDSMVIGTAPEEWMDDREKFRAAFGMEGVRLEAGNDLRAWEEGSVGWLADRPTFVLPDGSTIPTRLTAVMRQEDGEWKLVQAHFSVGVSDEEATT